MYTPTAMSHRINVIVHDDVWRFLREVPPGERSRTINSALREWALRHRRFDAAAEMDRLRDGAEATAERPLAPKSFVGFDEERERGH